MTTVGPGTSSRTIGICIQKEVGRNRNVRWGQRVWHGKSIVRDEAGDLAEVEDEAGVWVLPVHLRVEEDDLPGAHHNVQLLPSVPPAQIFSISIGRVLDSIADPGCTVTAYRQFMDKNKQLTLLSQCRLAFTGRSMLMALKFEGTSKKLRNQARHLFWPRSIHLCHQKPNPARETVPLRWWKNCCFSYAKIKNTL